MMARRDYTSLARIAISEVRHLIDEIESQTDPRTNKLLLELATTKTASVFQIFLKETKTLIENKETKTSKEKKKFRRYVINKYRKDGSTSTGLIGSYRDQVFHEGTSFLEKTFSFPGIKIDGSGIIAAIITDGSSLNIKGFHNFSPKGFEYVISSEGIFKVHGRGENWERWEYDKSIPYTEANNTSLIIQKIKEAICQLEECFFELNKLRTV